MKPVTFRPPSARALPLSSANSAMPEPTRPSAAAL